MPRAANSPNSPIEEGNKLGKGRPPGSRNKTTKAIHTASMLAAEAVGEDGEGLNGLVGYLKWLARNEPSSFATILGKLIPLQVTGLGYAPLRVESTTLSLKERQAQFAEDLKEMRQGRVPDRLMKVIEHRGEEKKADDDETDDDA